MNIKLPMLENPTTGNPVALSNLPDRWTFRPEPVSFSDLKGPSNSERGGQQGSARMALRQFLQHQLTSAATYPIYQTWSARTQLPGLLLGLQPVIA